MTRQQQTANSRNINKLIKRNFNEPMSVFRKVIQRIVLPFAKAIEKKDCWVSEVLVGKDVFSVSYLPKVPVKEIKINNKNQISAIFEPNVSSSYVIEEQKTYLPSFEENICEDDITKANKPFVGTLYKRDNGLIETFTMEMDRQGKYSQKPYAKAKNLLHFVFEFEHWLTGIFDYMNDNKIECEWKELETEYLKYKSLPMETKLNLINIVKIHGKDKTSLEQVITRFKESMFSY